MIESLISPSTVKKKPWEAFVGGTVFTIVAALLAMQIGSPSGAGTGFLIIAFISIAAAPFLVNMFRTEERRKGNIFYRHFPLIKIYGYLFVGVIFGSSLIYVVMPQEASTHLFVDQLNDLQAKGVVTGAAITAFEGTGAATTRFSFTDIFVNNSKVLLLAFVFSFMLGAGAVFLISWNASIIGALVGKIAENPALYGFPVIAQGNLALNYLVALPMTLVRLLPHGIFEFAAYFFGAIAGGILSAAMIQERIKKEYVRVFKDSLFYLGLSFALILIGAVIEVVV